MATSACRFPTSAASALGAGASLSGGMVPQYTAAKLSKPLLLVSDLDDTLARHTAWDVPHAAADAATSALKAMWESSRAAGIRCKLAINTGRCAWDMRDHSCHAQLRCLVSAQLW